MIRIIKIIFLVGLGFVLGTAVSTASAQQNSSGTFGTDPGHVNAFTEKGGPFNNRMGQQIIDNALPGTLYYDSEGNLDIESLSFYVKNEGGNLDYGIRIWITADDGGVSETSGYCEPKTIPAGFEGWVTWDEECDDEHQALNDRTPFAEVSSLAFTVTKANSPYEVRLGGYTLEHWEGGSCRDEHDNCDDVEDVAFSITFNSFGGWDGFDPYSPDPPQFPSSGVLVSDFFNTRFTGYSLATSTQDITVDYRIFPEEVNPNDPDRYPTHLRMRIADNEDVSIMWTTYWEIDIPEDSSVQQKTLFPVSALPDGFYTVSIDFYNWPIQQTFTGTNIYFDADIVSGVWDTPVRDSITDRIEPEVQRQCTYFRIDICIVNALVATAIPSEESFEKLADIPGITVSRFPFRYIGEIADLFADPTDEMETFVVSVPFSTPNGTTTLTMFDTQQHIVDNPIWPDALPFSTVRTLMGFVVYMLLVTYLWFRMRNLTDRA